MGEYDLDDRGIQTLWLDADGEQHLIARSTADRLREAVGSVPHDLEARAPIVTRPGRPLGLGPVAITCEDGSVRVVDGRLPSDFPLGYHLLRTAEGIDRRLIVSPGRCWLPAEQTWGWTVQLYGARSSASWGMGDLADLRELRTWTEEVGGGFLLINPLHAVAPVLPLEASPYLPATRCFRNPLYLCVQDVPGHSPDDVDASTLDRLKSSATIDRDAVWSLKRDALLAAYRRNLQQLDASSVSNFRTWREGQGDGLLKFATWSALVELHGADWHTWPVEFRDPGSPAIAAFQDSHGEEIDFHAWLQWQVDVQLRVATGGLTVIQDLPIGVSGGGADAWAWQDLLAGGISVGAPPDKLNSLGQNWGSPPMVPWRLREADYEPFIQSVRATISGAGGLRIDHVMGLFRLWWIPEGTGPENGGYVHYPSDDLLDIVALESHRASAVVVGEDLGTVAADVCEALRERGILSYKVLWFEDDDPELWPELALATVTTHDLPTVAGLWTGKDVDDQLAATDMSEEDVRGGRDELLQRLARDGLAPDAAPAEAIGAAYRQLGRAPSLLLSLSLEDAVAQEQRPNIPGTTERKNWQIPLPVLIEDLRDSDLAKMLVRQVTSGPRSPQLLDDVLADATGGGVIQSPAAPRRLEG